MTSWSVILFPRKEARVPDWWCSGCRATGESTSRPLNILLSGEEAIQEDQGKWCLNQKPTPAVCVWFTDSKPGPHRRLKWCVLCCSRQWSRGCAHYPQMHPLCTFYTLITLEFMSLLKTSGNAVYFLVIISMMGKGPLSLASPAFIRVFHETLAPRDAPPRRNGLRGRWPWQLLHTIDYWESRAHWSRCLRTILQVSITGSTFQARAPVSTQRHRPTTRASLPTPLFPWLLEITSPVFLSSLSTLALFSLLSNITSISDLNTMTPPNSSASINLVSPKQQKDLCKM